MNKNLLFLLGIIGITLFVVASILGGFLLEPYNPISQYISESMATGTEHGEALRYYAYIPSGLLLMGFGFFAPRKFPKSIWVTLGFVGIALFYGAATIIVAIFPCDAGCNKEWVDPSISQVIHNLTGLLTYLFVPLTMILIGLALRKFESYKTLAVFGILGGLLCYVCVGILSEPLTAYAGLLQRIIEIIFVIWIVGCAFAIKKGIKN